MTAGFGVSIAALRMSLRNSGCWVVASALQRCSLMTLPSRLLRLFSAISALMRARFGACWGFGRCALEALPDQACTCQPSARCSCSAAAKQHQMVLALPCLQEHSEAFLQWRQQPPAAQQPTGSASSQPPATDDSGLLLEIAAASADAQQQQQRMEGLQIWAHKLERTVGHATG